ncbi:hypothetical protein BKA82DRAFT_729605 [Pisolithus tinctorius]|uniref:Uncharacterized protein n=1 Tax=Pisolithus tinctorius Marx 270 TaxID=870435 RepID=A0A0C3JW27_PISTI|nr:hypothetical protein BKA82DRAFT_729605 [Pisolithus tinctorius]KIO01657.1 hypothetical protein M404DRAFT_729605 [Pisolithus tinctorius Marx 270]
MLTLLAPNTTSHSAFFAQVAVSNVPCDVGHYSSSFSSAILFPRSRRVFLPCHLRVYTNQMTLACLESVDKYIIYSSDKRSPNYHHVLDRAVALVVLVFAPPLSSFSPSYFAPAVVPRLLRSAVVIVVLTIVAFPGVSWPLDVLSSSLDVFSLSTASELTSGTLFVVAGEPAFFLVADAPASVALVTGGFNHRRCRRSPSATRRTSNATFHLIPSRLHGCHCSCPRPSFRAGPIFFSSMTYHIEQVVVILVSWLNSCAGR